MIRRLRFFTAIACASFAVACNNYDKIVTPPDPAPQLPSLDIYPTLDIYPNVHGLEIGATVQLRPILRDRFGSFIQNFAGTVDYSTPDTSIVVVTKTGRVTAIRPGIVLITAAGVLNGAARPASATVRVFPPAADGAVVVSFGFYGFDATPTRILAGQTVEWHVAPPNTGLWMIDNYYQNYASVTLVDGVASYRFKVAGTYHFCAGICWDSTDFGTVIVE